jgi:hypothetical protein
VTVSVANSAADFAQAGGSPAFQAGDLLISMEDGTVQWRHRDWTLVKVLPPDIRTGERPGLRQFRKPVRDALVWNRFLRQRRCEFDRKRQSPRAFWKRLRLQSVIHRV